MLKYSTYRSIYDEVHEDHTASMDRLNIKNLLLSLISSHRNRTFIRTDHIVKLALIVLLVISGFTVVGNVFAGSVSSAKQEKRVVVERGDTLWSIALKNKPADMKTAVYIEGIKRTSGLENSNIQAGDVLTLPVYSY
ncbi:LysM peptidoglycan-binding domain-containing protein [Paenibacillus sonchi]|uniref:LysM peptidoglycan-binding domain-containing protein n=1 Tax=Paenibacillus sonchi TaxID=373687 RepID=UPI001E45CB40|nr:LysM peptidoglycan-binding domain-containing protein [Paenibacillus sonchi]MCE3201329.1 LysM peptidoglycan-binding domain-containing protein [Paenibacillus sonchi]